ncbi:tryptophanyl-tRNA synthetase [Klebsiella pneumoniae]|uniref:Tryptophanyl-tRNA synthetase n=1 Tax=Klebsiella pneumoniae TaxID=573 RepID=A0A377USW3_KLEPN|nr:tryptophanyl-tRNA synthetase [Klebsiella pneumoniae]
MQTLLAPIRERRATFIQDKGMLLELLRQGSERAHHLTQQTLHEVKRGWGCRCCSEFQSPSPVALRLPGLRFYPPPLCIFTQLRPSRLAAYSALSASRSSRL